MELAVAGVIVTICLLLHVTGISLMVQGLARVRELFEHGAGRMFYLGLLVAVFSINMALHAAATFVWAAFYYSKALFDDFETSLYFSLTSYTTIGYGDIVLPRAWRLLGAIEGITGVLLFGVSTAFIFAVMNVIFQLRRDR
jgi:voltage-gated potassium channel